MQNKKNKENYRQTKIALGLGEKCRKIRKGKVPFALEEIQQYGWEIRLWTMMINKKGGQKISSKLITRNARSLNIKNHMELLKESTIQLRATAWRKYKEKRHAKDLRGIFIKHHAAQEEDKGNDNKAQQIHNIRVGKQERNAHQEIKYALSPVSALSILHIKILDNNNPNITRQTTDHKQMETEMGKNQIKISQSIPYPDPSQTLHGNYWSQRTNRIG